MKTREKGRGSERRPTTATARSGNQPTMGMRSATVQSLISIDWDFYADELKDSDLDEETKREFVECLFAIAFGFVDLAFRLHPLQQADQASKSEGLIIEGAVPGDACGQITELSTEIGAHLLSSDDTPQPALPEPRDIQRGRNGSPAESYACSSGGARNGSFGNRKDGVHDR